MGKMRFGFFRLMMQCNRFGQLRREIPMLCKPHADCRMIQSEETLFRFIERTARLPHFLKNHSELPLQMLLQDKLSDIMHEPRNKGFAADSLETTPCNHLACDADRYTMFPEFAHIEIAFILVPSEQIVHCHSETQFLDGIESEYHDGEIQRADTPRKSIERGIGIAQYSRRENLVCRYQLAKRRRIRAGIVDKLEQFRDHRGQLRQPAHALGDLLYPGPVLFTVECLLLF